MTSTNRRLHQERKCVYASTCFFMMVVLICCQEAFLVVLAEPMEGLQGDYLTEPMEGLQGDYFTETFSYSDMDVASDDDFTTVSSSAVSTTKSTQTSALNLPTEKSTKPMSLLPKYSTHELEQTETPKLTSTAKDLVTYNGFTNPSKSFQENEITKPTGLQTSTQEPTASTSTMSGSPLRTSTQEPTASTSTMSGSPLRTSTQEPTTSSSTMSGNSLQTSTQEPTASTSTMSGSPLRTSTQEPTASTSTMSGSPLRTSTQEPTASTSKMSSTSEARSIRTEIGSRENSLYTTNVMMSQITMATKGNQMVTTIALPTESSSSLSNNGGRTSRGIPPPTGFCTWYPYGSSSGAIETNDTDKFTKIVATGQGEYGDDKWNQTETFRDNPVRIRFKDKLIPGEVYNVSLSCCTNSSCDLVEILTVTEAFGPRYIDSCTVVAVNTTWAEFFWTSPRAVFQELTITLNLTNNNTVKQRNVTTKTPGVYTTNGTFSLHSLSSGARYMLSVFKGHRIYFTTVPQSPMKLKFDQQTYKSVRLDWSQPDYADSFTISYTTDENTYNFSSENNFIYLDNLSQNITYNVSVIAQTEQHFSSPVNLIINLEPPSLDISVLSSDTSQVTVKLSSAARLDNVEVSIDKILTHKYETFNLSQNLVIGSLMSGKQYHLQVRFKTGELSWKKNKNISTKPYHPTIVSNDTSQYGRVNICWTVEGMYQYVKVRFSHEEIYSPQEIHSKEIFCHDEEVQGGVIYLVSLVSVSNGLESEPENFTILTKPDVPVISELSKTSTSIKISISCPQRGIADHVKWTICPLAYGACNTQNLSCANASSMEYHARNLKSGSRYRFEAHAVRDVEAKRAESEIVSQILITYPNAPTDLQLVKRTGLAITIRWPHVCSHCNYSIYAIPLNQKLRTIETSSECEFSLDRHCEFSFSVVPEEPYTVVVKSISWGVESINGAEIHNVSMPTAKKKPTNIRLNSITPTLVHMDFDPPEVPYEHISAYIIEYGGRRTNGDVCSDDKMWLPPTHFRPINMTVKGGCKYNFTIKAYFGPTNEGELAWKIVNTMVGVLRPSEQVPRYPDHNYVTHHSFAIWFDPKLFDDENGPVETFSVIVAEASVNGKELTPGVTLPGWREAISQNPIPPYQAFHEVSVSTYQGEKEISKRSVADPLPVIIGGEDCGDDSPDYCNGHLTGGKSYVYWLRGFNAAGVFDSRVSPPFVLPKNQSTLIIGCLIILMILFLIVIILVGLLLRKRLHMDSKGTYQAAPTNSMLLQSMSRNSSRAKYIRAIKLSEFCQDFHIMSGHSNYGYSQEFENVRRVGRKMTCYDAVLPENVAKNRYTNILPYDKTRVRLGSIDDELGSDYINANYIPGFSSPREYIACQGPLPGTVDDMWRMVWEQNVSTIVMVTQLVENGKVKCEQYWPDDHKPVFYGDIQVTMTQTTETESWNLREFSLYRPSEDQRKKVKHCNYLSWPDHGVPQNSESLLHFIEVVRHQNQKHSSPMIVHCSAGCGRTGTFICMDRLLQQIDEFDYVNVLGTVAEMRSHRQHMIQTEQQYVFVHRCVLDILEENGLAPRPSSILMNGNSGGALLMEMI
ncbi:uncharacterized protein [Apostichopus japonicus]|uniref:uncharacterized protein isoform X1 n=1 Tax=Stichopus japonicus TaxID=307972 RepID=UPI003AB4F735